MPTVLEEAVAIQRRYYSETATKYEQMHAYEGDGNELNQKFIGAMLQMLDVKSVLDVGTATGFRLHDFRSMLPEAFICGVEPVEELLRVAHSNDVLISGTLIRGTGQALPFPDKSFDVVSEFAVLHHVERPDLIIREMLRVARKAVLISDSNRFGQGGVLARFAKLAMYKTKTWAAFDWLRTKGKGYRIMDGDGLCYSYSVYDSFELLASWADRLIVIPAGREKVKSWFHPVLTSGSAIALAIKESAA